MQSSQLEPLFEDRPLPGGEKVAQTRLVSAAIAKRNDGLAHQLAHRFGSWPTKNGFGHRVPVGDHAGAIHRYDRVKCGIPDAAKPPKVLALRLTGGLSFIRGMDFTFHA